MRKIDIAVINESTVVSDNQVTAALEALQTQVSRDFAPVWGTDAALSFVKSGTQPAPSSWWLVILDDSDQAGALGYHDLTVDGLPLGKVFAGTDQQYGNSWTVTASHELLELLADPDIDLTVFDQQTATGGTLYAYEVCDPCEADQYAYDIDGTRVSDFVYPGWFQPHAANGTQLDQQSLLKSPLELLPGGYIGVFDVTVGTGWTQRTLELPGASRYAMRAPVGSRRERRRTPREEWLPSRKK